MSPLIEHVLVEDTTGSSQKRRRCLLMAATTLSVVLIAFVAAVGAAFVNLPSCESCHSDEDFGASTASSAHADMRCTQCHATGGPIDRLAFATHTVSQRVGLPVGLDARALAAVPDTTCISCHEAVAETTTESNGIRIAHAECAVGAACSDCHASTAHGDSVSWRRDYSMDACLRCHGQQAGLVDCGTCHVERAKRDRLATGPWTVTHGANWQETHGMGDAYTCAACHQKGYCDRCHGVGLPHDSNFRIEHVSLAQSPEAQCTSCHSQKFCGDCHGTEMPHTSSFVMEHSAIVEEDGDALCKKCHSEQDCATCHVSHVHPGGAIGAAPLNSTGGGR